RPGAPAALRGFPPGRDADLPRLLAPLPHAVRGDPDQPVPPHRVEVAAGLRTRRGRATVPARGPAPAGLRELASLRLLPLLPHRRDPGRPAAVATGGAHAAPPGPLVGGRAVRARRRPDRVLRPAGAAPVHRPDGPDRPGPGTVPGRVLAEGAGDLGAGG